MEAQKQPSLSFIRLRLYPRWRPRLESSPSEVGYGKLGPTGSPGRISDKSEELMPGLTLLVAPARHTTVFHPGVFHPGERNIFSVILESTVDDFADK